MTDDPPDCSTIPAHQLLSTLYRVPLGVLVFVSMAVQFSHSTGAADWDPSNFISFFTIQSNVVAASLFLLGATVWRRRSSPTIDSWRGAAVVYMVVTGLVYAVLLSGLDAQLQTTLPWVNTILHRVMPIAVALDWLIVPPGSRLGFGRAARWLIFPTVWLVYTLVRGAIVGWYPYPFVDVAVKGYLGVALSCIGIAVLFLALTWAVVERYACPIDGRVAGTAVASASARSSPLVWPVRKERSLIRVPREDVGDRLTSLVRDQGVAFTSDPNRVRSLLHAQAGGTEPDVSLLATAADAGITTALVVTRGWATPRLLSDLARRLVVEQGLSPADARWVVEAWAKALGVKAPSVAAVQTATATATERHPSRSDVARPGRSERPRLRQVVSLSLLALVVAVAAVAIVLSRAGSGGTIGATAVPLSRPQAEVPAATTVSVPTVTSMTKSQAIDRLESLGLDPVVTTRSSQDAKRGTVLRQDPEPGTSLGDGARVVLVVAVPPTRVGTPVGLSFERTPTSVTITWDPPRDGSGVDHYEIWRSGQMIGTRHAGRRTFTDAGLSPGRSYLYGVKAIGYNGTQATSRTRDITLPAAAAPPSPSPAPFVEAPPVAPPAPPSLTPPPPSPCPAPDPEFCD